MDKSPETILQDTLAELNSCTDRMYKAWAGIRADLDAIQGHRTIIWEPLDKDLDYMILSPELVRDNAQRIMGLLSEGMKCRDNKSYMAYEYARSIWLTMHDILGPVKKE